jgi:hypothetical protein
MWISLLELGLRLAVFGAGFWLAVTTVMSVIRSFVLPRAHRPWLTSLVFTASFRAFYYLRLQKATTYEERDRLLALYSPVTLFFLPLAWLTFIMVGYTAMLWAVGDGLSLRDAFLISGSSLMTLGFRMEDQLALEILAMTEAALGMILIALLIGYLPTMYSAFSKRETVVTLLEVRAGAPASAVNMILRLNRIGILANADEMQTMWQNWETWFAEIEESHTTLAPLVFFRSPKSHRSWVVAAGVIIDAGALIASTVDMPTRIHAPLCIRAGYVTLRSIADFFGLQYNPDPQPDAPISIAREEYDAVYDELMANGVPVKADRDQCWRDFAGWRVNYDEVLLQIARLTWAPYAQWISDRSIVTQRRADSRELPIFDLNRS